MEKFKLENPVLEVHLGPPTSFCLFYSPPPIKALASLNISNYWVRGERGAQIGAGNHLTGFFRLPRTPASAFLLFGVPQPVLVGDLGCTQAGWPSGVLQGACNSELCQQLAGLASWLTRVRSLVVLCFLRIAERRRREGWASGRDWSHNWGSLGSAYAVTTASQEWLFREKHTLNLAGRATNSVSTFLSPGSQVSMPPVHVFSFFEQS